MDDAGDAEGAGLGVPGHADVVLLGTGEGGVEDKSGRGVEDVNGRSEGVVGLFWLLLLGVSVGRAVVPLSLVAQVLEERMVHEAAHHAGEVKGRVGRRRVMRRASGAASAGTASEGSSEASAPSAATASTAAASTVAVSVGMAPAATAMRATASASSARGVFGRIEGRRDAFVAVVLAVAFRRSDFGGVGEFLSFLCRIRRGIVTALLVLGLSGSGIRMRSARIHIIGVRLRIIMVMRRTIASAASAASSPVGLVREVVGGERERAVRWRVRTAEWERRRCVGVIYTGAWLARRDAIRIESAVEGMENVPWVIVMGCHDDGCALFEESCKRNKVKKVVGVC